MSSPKKSSFVDPDYELTEVAREQIKLKENAENQETLQKIIDIINREFTTELVHRQSQLDLIQQRLHKAQKTLHLLKYVLINTYYNDPGLFVQNQEESSSEDQFISNKNRMHPALKKILLGLNSNDYNLNVSKSPRKKMKYVETVNTKIENENLSLENMSEHDNKAVIQGCKNEEIKPSNCNVTPEQEEYMIRNRKKVKYRIVVGNISKWMPSESEEDKSTHKWMMYVRGSKENPDISHFVEKVVFYLHPSYQPNDVVELRHPPFHLSRRGWGEFPLRVKIFFQYSRNKPVDIIHTLKLDKSFTGQQTLGNETVINLFLYKNENAVKVEDNCDDKGIIPKIKEETEDYYSQDTKSNVSVDTLDDVANETVNYAEHDYCTLNDEMNSTESSAQIYDSFREHSYARTNASTESVNSEEQSNHVVYELGNSHLQNDDVVMKELNANDSKHTILAITKTKRPQESLLKKDINKNASQTVDLNNSRLIVLHSNSNEPKTPLNSTGFVPIDYKKYQINLPKNRFKTAREALPYLFKRMPLISGLASNLDYKCTFPFAAKSLNEYSSWNIGRRLSSEWFRAKMVLKLITQSKLKNFENYSAKILIMYARAHGYTPLANYEIFNNNACTNVSNIDEYASEAKRKLSILIEPEIVDVINCTPDDNKPNSPSFKIKLVDQRVERACSFVKQVVLDAGIILKPQEIIPGVIFNGPERMLLQALLCLAEDLIRNARSNLVYKGNFQEDSSVIETEDIRSALTQRPQFKYLMKFDLNSI